MGGECEVSQYFKGYEVQVSHLNFFASNFIELSRTSWLVGTEKYVNLFIFPS